MKLVFTIIFLSIASAIFSQTIEKALHGSIPDSIKATQHQNIIINCGCGRSPNQTILYLVDGKAYENVDLLKLQPNEIEALTILKSPLSEKVLGKQAKDGSVIIFMKHTDSLKAGNSDKIISLRDPALQTPKELFFIIDGVPQDSVRFNNNSFDVFDSGVKRTIVTDEIEKAKFLTAPISAAIYGVRGANGAVIIKTNNSLKEKTNNEVVVVGYGKQTKPELMHSYINNDDIPTPLFFVNGKETPADIVNSLKPQIIKKIEVFRDAEEIKKYGSNGKNGVVLITTERQKMKPTKN